MREEGSWCPGPARCRGCILPRAWRRRGSLVGARGRPSHAFKATVKPGPPRMQGGGCSSGSPFTPGCPGKINIYEEKPWIAKLSCKLSDDWNILWREKIFSEKNFWAQCLILCNTHLQKVKWGRINGLGARAFTLPGTKNKDAKPVFKCPCFLQRNIILLLSSFQEILSPQWFLFQSQRVEILHKKREEKTPHIFWKKKF